MYRPFPNLSNYLKLGTNQKKKTLLKVLDQAKNNFTYGLGLVKVVGIAGAFVKTL